MELSVWAPTIHKTHLALKMYIKYTMYIMIIKYTIVDFRTKLREAFNGAENGDIVVIDRFGVSYELTAMQGKSVHKVQNVQKSKPVEVAKPVETNVHKVQPVHILPTAIPTTLKEGNDPKSPGYSAPVRPDIIKTPSQATEKLQTVPKPQLWSGPISKNLSARKKGQRVKSDETYEDLGL